MSLHLVGWTLIHSVWEDAILAALVGAMLGAGRELRSGTRYLLCVAALGCMIVMPMLTAALLNGAPGLAPGARAAGLPAGVLAETTRERLDLAAPWLVRVWLIGVVGFSVRLIAGLARTRSLVAVDTRPASAWVEALARRLTASLGIRRGILVLESSRIHVPLVAGWLRPALLLPASLVTGLTPHQLELIIIHELAHIRRHDYLVNVCQAVAETLLFYHPAAWWLSARVREEREHCCDDFTLAICGGGAFAREYATVLLAIEESRGLALGFATAATGGSLLRRVRRLLGTPPGPNPALGARARVGGVAVVVAALMAGIASLGVAPRGRTGASVTAIPVSRAAVRPVPAGTRLGQRQRTLPPTAKPVSDASGAQVDAEPQPALKRADSIIESPVSAARNATSAALAQSPPAQAAPLATAATATARHLLAPVSDSAIALTRTVAALSNVIKLSADSALRLAALKSLGQLAPATEARDELERLTWQSPSTYVQVAAMGQLHRFDDTRRLRVFLYRVLRAHPSDDVRLIAATLLNGP